MKMWNPWRGCHKISTGCKYCYIHKGDKRRGVDTNNIVKLPNFNYPVRRRKDGTYFIKSGKTVYLCFSSDFFIEEADAFRKECFAMIKERRDLNFIFLTKRIERFYDVIPEDWEDGYDNVTIGCTVCTQAEVESKLKLFSKLPIKHKNIILQPLLEEVDISKYLDNIELVVVGGESDFNGRVLNYDWVLKIREDCINKNIPFEFRQCSTNFIKDGNLYNLKTKDLMKFAHMANINTKKRR